MRQSKTAAPFALLYCAAFVAAFNENIVNTGLSDIMDEFGLGSATAQWLVTGYMIVTTIVVVAMAFLLSRFRLRSLFLAGAGLLCGGSALAIAAPNFPVLLVARLVQAGGTGIFVPAMMSTVATCAPRERMGTYLAVGSCAITLGPALGPVVSGGMVTALGWRSVFSVPLVLVALLAAAGVPVLREESMAAIRRAAGPDEVGPGADDAPAAAAEGRPRFDALSIAFAAAGLTCFSAGLVQVGENALAGGVLACAGLAGIAAFAVRQFRLPSPVLDLFPLKDVPFALAGVLSVVSMMATFSLSVLLPLYFEGACGASAFLAGAFILAPIAVNAMLSLVGGRVLDRCGSWPLLPVGFALITAGFIVMGVVAGGCDAVPVMAGACIVYAGVGAAMSPSQTAGLQRLGPAVRPHGVSIINTFVQMAASIGPSLYVGILSSASASAASAGASAAAAQASGFAAAMVAASVVGALGVAASVVFCLLARR